MAGTYADVPGYRFAYDQDGTSVIRYVSDVGTTQSIGTLQKLNSDAIASSITAVGLHHLVFLFPEKRDLSGIFINSTGDNFLNGTLDWSSDTTNGIDGTWNNILNTISNSQRSASKTIFRSAITPLAVSSAVSLRFSNVSVGYTSYSNVQIYGSIATIDSPDRLRIVDLSGDDIAAQLDFGDIRQRNNVTKQFKVVNNSSAMTANNITISFDAPTNANPSLIGQYQLSTDNTAFANAINIGTLAPGASSAALYLRDTISATAQLSVWSLRLIASANTWS